MSAPPSAGVPPQSSMRWAGERRARRAEGRVKTAISREGMVCGDGVGDGGVGRTVGSGDVVVLKN